MDLSALEFRLLAAFVRRRGRLLSRDQLMARWVGQEVRVEAGRQALADAVGWLWRNS